MFTRGFFNRQGDLQVCQRNRKRNWEDLGIEAWPWPKPCVSAESCWFAQFFQWQKAGFSMFFVETIPIQESVDEHQMWIRNRYDSWLIYIYIPTNTIPWRCVPWNLLGNRSGIPDRKSAQCPHGPGCALPNSPRPWMLRTTPCRRRCWVCNGLHPQTLPSKSRKNVEKCHDKYQYKPLEKRGISYPWTKYAKSHGFWPVRPSLQWMLWFSTWRCGI